MATMIRHLLCASGLLMLVPATAGAQDVSSDVVTLSPAARDAVLEHAAHGADELPINGLHRGVHGEVGVEVGSNGGRAVYGTASVPLGDTGSATVSFVDSRGGRWRRRY